MIFSNLVPRVTRLGPRVLQEAVSRVFPIPRTDFPSRRVGISCLLARQSVKPRLHERFFACGGDAIFSKIVASPARSGRYTWRQISTKSVILSQNIQLDEFLAICFCDFLAFASPVRGWLHMRFSPRAGDATIASPSGRQKIPRVAAA